MACVPICDDSLSDYVILLLLSVSGDSLGGLITEGWRTLIMEMAITMMHRLVEMEISKEQWAIPSHICDVFAVLITFYFHMLRRFVYVSSVAQVERSLSNVLS